MYAPHAEQFIKHNAYYSYRQCSKGCRVFITDDYRGRGNPEGCLLGLEKYIIQVKEPTKEMTIADLFIQDK